MNINSINYTSGVKSFKSMQELQKKMIKLSVGQKIKSMANNAANSAVSETLKSLANQSSVESDNAQDVIGMYNVADGGLASISDSLNRLNKIAIKAKNGIYSDKDRALMQVEVDQIKQSIEDEAKNTEFNSIKLLDGSNNNNGLISVNSTLESLGIADFDVTGNYDIDSIKKALSKVNKQRSQFGAGSNVLEHYISSKDIQNHNTVVSLNQIADTDYGRVTTQYVQQDALSKAAYGGVNAGFQQYVLSMQI